MGGLVIPPFQPGDWVQVWGQVLPTEQVHPDDAVVEFFSHSEQWSGHVRRDRITKPDDLPDFAERCAHLGATDLENENLYRCARHHGHIGYHQARGGEFNWDDKGSVGFIEARC